MTMNPTENTAMSPRILAAGHVVTMDDARRVIVDGAVAVENGCILMVDTRAAVTARWPDAPVEYLPDALLMPGLINAHAHSGLLRGTAEHLPVWEWLTQHINPMHRVLTAQEAELASRVCYAEALLSGTTTVVDMWRFMDGSARAAEEMGLRAVLVPYVGAHPDYDYFDTLDDNEALIERWHGAANGRIDVWVGLEHPFYADEVGMRRAVDMAIRHRTGFHTHLSESELEPPEFVSRYGVRPVQAMEKLGVLDTPHVMFAHAVWLDESEIALCARHDVAIAHNPVSNMKLASGIASVEDMLDAGLAVGLGTDGEKENNNLDMFEEMKTASLLAKLGRRNAAALDSWKVLDMATRLGARAVGHGHELGQLAPGFRADIIAVRTNTPRMTPLVGSGQWANLHHNLVHAAQGGDVCLTMVDGRVVARDGQVLTEDLPALLAQANAVAPALFARRAQWLADNGALTQWTNS